MVTAGRRQVSVAFDLTELYQTQTVKRLSTCFASGHLEISRGTDQTSTCTVSTCHMNIHGKQASGESRRVIQAVSHVTAGMIPIADYFYFEYSFQSCVVGDGDRRVSMFAGIID